MSRIYDATGKFAFDLFDINVMMSRFCLTRIFVDPKVWENMFCEFTVTFES